MSLEGIHAFLPMFEHEDRLPRGLISVPVRSVRVWRTADTLAGRIAIWVRWSVWLLTWGKAGALPWTCEAWPWPGIVFEPVSPKALRRLLAGHNLTGEPPGPCVPPAAHLGGSADGIVRARPVPPPNVAAHG